MEHADYILMRAPKPTLMCVATQDFFDIGGARTTFQEATDIYRKMDAVRKVDFFEYDDKHGFSKPRREAATRWLKKWLVGVDEPISEGDFPSFKDADLQCTRSGQVLEDFKGKSAFHLNAEEAKRLTTERAKFPDMTLEKRQREIRRLLGLTEDRVKHVPGGKHKGPILPDESFTIEGIVFDTEPGLALHGWWYNKGRGQGKLVVYLPDGGSGDGRPAPAIEKMVRDGAEVLRIQVRGFDGPRRDKSVPASKPAFFGNDFKETFLSLHLNRPLLGQRVHDVQQMLNLLWVAKSSKNGLHLVGEGVTGLVALHVAALLPRTDVTVTLDRTILSWANVAQTPVSYNQLSSVVPGVLRVYDLPELAATLAPRKLTIRNPVDAAQRPVAQTELEKTYDACRRAYAKHDAGGNLTLIGAR
jgi:hypothetical protein